MTHIEKMKKYVIDGKTSIYSRYEPGSYGGF